MENLRPQHFLDAMLVKPIDTDHDKVLLMNLTDEDNAFYILPVVHDNGNGQLELTRSVWFNRYNLTIARQFIFDDDRQHSHRRTLQRLEELRQRAVSQAHRDQPPARRIRGGDRYRQDGYQ